MSEIGFFVLEIVASFCAALFTVCLVPYIREQLADKQYEDLLGIIDIAVRYAEQTLKTGTVKKADVVKFVTDWLNTKSIKITEEQLDRLIEAAVYSLKLEKQTKV